MLNRPLTILLAVFVITANAYCACAGASRIDAGRDVGQGTPKKHSHCHPAPPEKQEGCRDKKKPGERDRGSHTCGHCTGTVTADTAQAKTTLPSLRLSPLHFAPVSADRAVFAGSFRGIAFDYCDLPPPLPPPTLFNLSCSLNN